MPQLTGLHLYPVKSTYRLSPQSADVEPWGLTGDRRWMLVDDRGRAVTQRDQPLLALYRATPAPDGGLLMTAPDGATVEIAAPSVERGDPQAEVEIFGTLFGAAEAAKEVQLWFAERLGDVRLVHLDRPHTSRPIKEKYRLPGETVSMADGFPLLLTTTASLAELNRRIAADHPDDPVKGAALPMERFRPNLVVDGAEPWAEESWRRVAIGGLTFRAAKLCARCVVTTTDQESGVRRGPEPLRALGRHHRIGQKLIFGVNLVPERPTGVTGDRLGTVRIGDELTVLTHGPYVDPEDAP
ncbi:MOSC N-terminal beta barrel domain-containing protein [Kitasatospora sp. NPDC049258]|uniref:MOSC domain-containing protein n=1 Tax=Kitasatospora sp. NPDC049258 TaxID=3155394 RepID=UPI0034449431